MIRLQWQKAAQHTRWSLWPVWSLIQKKKALYQEEPCPTPWSHDSKWFSWLPQHSENWRIRAFKMTTKLPKEGRPHHATSPGQEGWFHSADMNDDGEISSDTPNGNLLFKTSCSAEMLSALSCEQKTAPGTHWSSHIWKQERKEQIKTFLVLVLSRAFSENCTGHSEVTHLLAIA